MGGIDGNKQRSSVVRGDVVFVMLFKMNCDLIVNKSINSNSHSNCSRCDARENTRARRAPHVILRGKLAHKTSLNLLPEKAD